MSAVGRNDVTNEGVVSGENGADGFERTERSDLSVGKCVVDEWPAADAGSVGLEGEDRGGLFRYWVSSEVLRRRFIEFK